MIASQENPLLAVDKSVQALDDDETLYKKKLASALAEKRSMDTDHPPPIFNWPVNMATLRDPRTRITSYHSKESPGITLQTPEIGTIIRSPVDAMVMYIRQSNKLYTVVLSVPDTPFLIALENLPEVANRPEELQEAVTIKPSLLRTISAGDIIGNLGSRHALSIQMLRKLKRVDPLPYLQPLYQ